jgi:hypothetical protein
LIVGVNIYTILHNVYYNIAYSLLNLQKEKVSLYSFTAILLVTSRNSVTVEFHVTSMAKHSITHIFEIGAVLKNRQVC